MIEFLLEKLYVKWSYLKRLSNKLLYNYLLIDVVIIPKEIRLRVEDMTDEEAVELFYVSREVASKMEKYYNATCKLI